MVLFKRNVLFTAATSNFLSDLLAQQTGRFDNQHDDQYREHDGVRQLGRDVRLGKYLNDTQQDAADHGAGNGTNPAEHRRGERFDPGHSAGGGHQGGIRRTQKHAGNGRQTRANGEGQGNGPIDIDAHQLRCPFVLRTSPHGLAHFGLASEPNQGDHNDHTGENGHQRHVGNGQLPVKQGEVPVGHHRGKHLGPTLNYVDMFPWEDGTDFPANFDWKSPSKQPFFTKGEMVPTRDPRLYENVACPGDTYCNGTTAPVYINHADYKDGSGFLIMKYILQENNDREGPVQWSHTRLAEIMLGYAEVLNEVNGRPTDEAYKMVNDVRKRVGLPELSKTMNHDQFLEAVLRERALELGFEEVRWFDLVRRDRQSDFKKKLYGLRSRGNDLNNPTEFTFEKIELGDHYWATNWDTKWYLAPIPQEEINKQYGMTQNPGW